ncbi:hypothetical protein H7I92_19350, partial [Mycobacterium riyadhense]|nr:hypothetical protein [Mycobacterium riyadhense]
MARPRPLRRAMSSMVVRAGVAYGGRLAGAGVAYGGRLAAVAPVLELPQPGVGWR